MIESLATAADSVLADDGGNGGPGGGAAGRLQTVSHHGFGTRKAPKPVALPQVPKGASPSVVASIQHPEAPQPLPMLDYGVGDRIELHSLTGPEKGWNGRRGVVVSLHVIKLQIADVVAFPRTFLC